MTEDERFERDRELFRVISEQDLGFYRGSQFARWLYAAHAGPDPKPEGPGTEEEGEEEHEGEGDEKEPSAA